MSALVAMASYCVDSDEVLSKGGPTRLSTEEDWYVAHRGTALRVYVFTNVVREL